MTQEQKASFLQVVSRLRYLSITDRTSTVTFSHGGCVGADHEAHNLLLTRQMGFRVEIYPASDVDWKYVSRDKGAIKYPPAPALERNREIVNRSQILLAAPKTNSQVLRSGTWSTVRYAIGRGVPVLLLKREGGYEVFRPEEKPGLWG